MKTHKLKIAPEYYEAVYRGLKLFEIRKNDRDFEVEDVIILEEFDNDYVSSPKIIGRIKYITAYAQRDGFVVFGFDVVGIE